MSLEIEKTIHELLIALDNLSKVRGLYKRALLTAKEKADELSALSHNLINQPHILLDEYEIDN